MKKSIILFGIIIVSISLLISGCNKTNNVLNVEGSQHSNEQNSNLPNEEQQPAIIPPENAPQTLDSSEEEQFEVSDSDSLLGWKELKAKVTLFDLNINSEGISWSPLSNKKMTTFSLDFPGNWKFNGFSVFNNQSNKVAELVPLTEAAITIDDLYQNYQPSVVAGEEVIFKELSAVNDYQCLRIISQNEIPNWYPHSYYISNGTYIFGIMFYSCEVNELDQQLFEQVIHTFKFEDE
ncbi:MAG: hypothetical protein CVU87_08385 [Firmicutes bacterium HGW-Firmicutes-12]|nr:MAG: hypothetical protein CVU87_08385 [Firmicutes bacterium HGW-Firmicutes-12]